MSVSSLAHAPICTGHVDLVNDHHEVLPLWQSYGLQNQTLIHLDTHQDFRWIAEKNPKDLLNAGSLHEMQDLASSQTAWSASGPDATDLGNYLYHVLRLGMVRQWYWIVPDPIWDSPRFRKAAWKDLMTLYRIRTGPMSRPVQNDNYFQTQMMGVDTVVTALRHLPVPEGPVLLNLDVDYLTTQGFDPPKPPRTNRCTLPWIWPDELLTRLREKKVSSSTAAVSFSVRGGFTPIQFKFLGQALYDLLRGQDPSEDYELLRKAFLARFASEPSSAVDLLKQIRGRDIYGETAFYQKAQIDYEIGNQDQARKEYENLNDPDFFSFYNSQAKVYEGWNDFDGAREEHQMMKALIPESLEPLAGEARAWMFKNDFKKALDLYFEILKRKEDHFEAHFQIGMLQLISNPDEAVKHLFRAVFIEPHHFRSRLAYGSALLETNLIEEAKTEFRECLRRGFHFPIVYHHLVRTYLRAKNYWKAWDCFKEQLRLTLLVITKRLLWN